MAPADLFDLTGKVGLVTGANSGLGFGFASGIAKCGGDVVVWARRADKNKEAADRLLEMGAGRVFSQSIDVTSEQHVIEGMAEAVAEMGRIDGVVANAGFATMEPFHEMKTETYESLLAVSQHGGFFTLREGVKHMKARADAGDPGGSIIVCGSLTNIFGHVGLAHYAAAKGAMAGIMRCIAVEYGNDGIRANMVAAGLMYTEILGGIPEDQLPFTEILETSNPIPRWGYPADIEGITAYLMSDCSSYHTGDLIVIDGGQSKVSLT